MKTIIERQKVKSFINKITIEWPGCIDHCVFESEKIVYIHLQHDISPIDFIRSLMPKAGMFVDFETKLKIIFIGSCGEIEAPLTFND